MLNFRRSVPPEFLRSFLDAQSSLERYVSEGGHIFWIANYEISRHQLYQILMILVTSHKTMRYYDTMRYHDLMISATMRYCDPGEISHKIYDYETF